MGKILFLKPVVFFSNLYENHSRKQNEMMRKKIEFLYDQAFRYFYEQEEMPEIAEVDLPEFIYEKKRKDIAKTKTLQALLEVIKDGRVDECYRKRIAQLKKIKKIAL